MASGLTPEVTASYEGVPVTRFPDAAGYSLDDPKWPEIYIGTDIEQALAQIRLRLPFYARYERYYLGSHRLAYATEKFRNAFANLFYSISDNLCQVVVDSIADRLQVSSFGVEEGDENLPDAGWEVWQRNRMDEHAGLVHREALRSGDAYVIVWPDENGFPLLWPNMAEMMTVRYEDENPSRLSWAAKLWMDSDRRLRLNMYYPDRIEKYATKSVQQSVPDKAGAFEPFETQNERWPIDNPYGEVPVVHFANNAWIASFGMSELANVIPLQDALNKSLCDQLVAQEFAAFPQRYATGIEVQYDEHGQPIAPFKPGVDRLWTTAATDAKFGQFEQARLSDYLEVQTSLRGEIARVAALPPHYMINLAGGYPSGEALRTAEAPLVSKVKARQASFGNAWENVIRLALLEQGEDPELRLFTNWYDAAPISENARLDQLLKKQAIGVTTSQLLTEAGYGETQIQDMEVERANERAAREASFNAGMIG